MRHSPKRRPILRATAFAWMVAMAGCGQATAPRELTDSVRAAQPFERRPMRPASRALTYPVRAALAADGTLYVTDTGAGAVFGYRGKQRVFQLLDVERPLGVAVAGERLWVGDAGRKTVEVFSTLDGSFRLAFEGEIGMPNAIAVTPDRSRVFVADSVADEVLVYDASGELTGGFGGDGSLRFPAALAVDASRVVVADQGHHRVEIFSHDGARVGGFGALPRGTDLRGAMVRPQGIALVGDDIAVLDSFFGVVQMFANDGAALGFVGARGDCDACVDLALDLVWDELASRFVVLDPHRRRWVDVPLAVRGQP